jgi:hypothetical protein
MSYSASAPAPVEDPCATDAAPSDHLLGLRIGALFAILFVSCIGVAVPYVAQSPRPGPTFFVLRAVAGGVVLITGEALACMHASCAAACFLLSLSSSEEACMQQGLT